MLGPYALHKNPLTTALTQHADSIAAESECSELWTIGATSSSSLGFFIGDQLHSSLNTGGLIWQTRGNARTKFGALAPAAPGMLRGETCTECALFKKMVPRKSTALAVGAGWEFGESVEGPLVLIRTEVRNGEPRTVHKAAQSQRADEGCRWVPSC